MTCSCNCKRNSKSPRSVLGIVMPAIVLALLPKCPLCIVAYAAMLGVGVSFESAQLVRSIVAVACVVALAVVAVRSARK